MHTVQVPIYIQLLCACVVSLLLLMLCVPTSARYLNSTVYESEYGLIDAISVDITSGCLVLGVSNSIIRLNFDRQEEQVLSFGPIETDMDIPFIESLHIKNQYHPFFCTPGSRKCLFVIPNGNKIYVHDVQQIINGKQKFIWTQDGSFALSLNDTEHKYDYKLVFVVNNVERTFSPIFSLWNISYDPMVMSPLETGLSGLKIVSPHVLKVIVGFQYDNKLYYLVRIKPRRTSRSRITRLLQIDITTSKHRVIATKLQCDLSSIATTAYYLKESPRVLYASFEGENDQIICGFKMVEVDKYFQKVREDCKMYHRGSRIVWLQEMVETPALITHRDFNPCFNYVSLSLPCN